MTADLETQIAELRAEVRSLRAAENRLWDLVFSHICRTNPRLSELEIGVWALEAAAERTVEPPMDPGGALAALVANLADVRRRLER